MNRLNSGGVVANITKTMAMATTDRNKEDRHVGGSGESAGEDNDRGESPRSGKDGIARGTSAMSSRPLPHPFLRAFAWSVSSGVEAFPWR